MALTMAMRSTLLAVLSMAASHLVLMPRTNLGHGLVKRQGSAFPDVVPAPLYHLVVADELCFVPVGGLDHTPHHRPPHRSLVDGRCIALHGDPSSASMVLCSSVSTSGARSS